MRSLQNLNFFLKNWPQKFIPNNPFEFCNFTLIPVNVSQIYSLSYTFIVHSSINVTTTNNLVCRNLLASSLFAVHFIAPMPFRIITVRFKIFIFRSDLYFYFLANAATLAFPYFSIFVLTSLTSNNKSQIKQ